MGTAYDVATVTVFFLLVGYYLFLTDRRPQLLTRFLFSAIVFVVANQVGNFATRTGEVGAHALAVALIIGGVAYAGIVACS
jgi:hypothetical protein